MRELHGTALQYHSKSRRDQNTVHTGALVSEIARYVFALYFLPPPSKTLLCLASQSAAELVAPPLSDSCG